jgi:DNA-binding MurR/RpiR family transcriptional regulator
MRRTLDDVGEDTSRAIALVLEAHAEAFEAARTPASQAVIAEAIGVLHPAERIFVFGIGPSAALATYVALLLTRSGRRSGVLNVTGGMLADQMLDLRAGDALIVLAYGRAYREVSAVFAAARRLGLPLVLVTDSLDRKLARFANVVLPARRGRTERVALHGVTLVCLEAVILGLAAAHRKAAIAALERLDELRAEVVAGWGEEPRTLVRISR